MTPTVVFPGAGSFGGELAALLKALGPAAWPARYPGRHGRDFGVPAESFDAVVRECAGQVAARSAAPPMLVGHSFGAYVAYATAARLREQGLEVPVVVAVGANAPGRFEVPEHATASPAGATAYLHRVDPSALAAAPSDDWREVVAETVMHDLRLLRQFVAASVPVVRCAVYAARGAADPLTSDAAAGNWARHTGGPFALRVFPGGHSQLLGSPDFLTWVREVQDSAAQPAAAAPVAPCPNREARS